MVRISAFCSKLLIQTCKRGQQQILQSLLKEDSSAILLISYKDKVCTNCVCIVEVRIEGGAFIVKRMIDTSLPLYFTNGSSYQQFMRSHTHSIDSRFTHWFIVTVETLNEFQAAVDSEIIV